MARATTTAKSRKTAAKTPAQSKAAAAPKSKSGAAAKAKPAAPVSASAGGDEFALDYARKHYVVGRVLAGMSLYFRVSLKEELPVACTLFGQTAKLADIAQCNWWRRDDRDSWSRVDARTLPGFTKHLEGCIKDDRGARFAQIEPHETDEDAIGEWAAARVVDVKLHSRGGMFFSDNASMLRAAVPIEEMRGQAANWRALVVSACEALPIHAGVVGPILAEGPLRKQKADIDKRMKALMFERPALDIEEDLTGLLVRPGVLRWVGWLTVVGDAALKACGGEAKVKAALGSAAVVHRTATGCVIEAGPGPNAGDDVEAMEAYRVTYRALAPAFAPLVTQLNPEGKALWQRLA